MKKIKIKRFDKKLPLPEYKTRGAAAFDLFAREKVLIRPGTVESVPLNIAVQKPKDCFLLLAARSSTFKFGVGPVNGIGVGDPDFCGDGDEYRIPLYNYTKKSVVIDRGTRIAQGLFVKFVKASWQEVKKMKSKTRGGFGTTGHK